MNTVLIVEGHDEHTLIEKLCKLHNFESIQIINAQGNGNIQSKFTIALKAASAGTGVSKIAVLCDSEEDPVQCKIILDSLADQIKLSPNPTIKYSYLILPAEDAAGSLETLCLGLIAGNDPLLGCVNTFLSCIEAFPNALTTQARRDKARFLLWQHAAHGKSAGIKSLIDHGLISVDHPVFAPIVNFLRTL